MSNPNIETYHGKLPACRQCGKLLRPQYETVRESVFTDKATGKRKRYYDEEYSAYIGIPVDATLNQEDKHNGVEIYWDAKRQLWWRWEKVYRVKSRRFKGTFGVRGNNFFCSTECGFRWAVAHLRKNQA